MSATKAFAKVVTAYMDSTGQSKAEAQDQVAEALAVSWAADAFGDGMAQRFKAGNASAAPDEQEVDE